MLSLIRDFQDSMKIKTEKPLSPMGCLKLSNDIQYEVITNSSEIKTSVTVLYLQIGEGLLNELISFIIKVYCEEPFFDELRTKRQLGYKVKT